MREDASLSYHHNVTAKRNTSYSERSVGKVSKAMLLVKCVWNYHRNWNITSQRIKKKSIDVGDGIITFFCLVLAIDWNKGKNAEIRNSYWILMAILNPCNILNYKKGIVNTYITIWEPLTYPPSVLGALVIHYLILWIGNKDTGGVS